MNLNKKRLLDIVVKICNEYPAAANNDAILLEQVWLAEGWDDSKPLEDNIRRVSRPETLTRRRRELYNLGLIDYTKTAEKARGKAFLSELDQHTNYLNNMFYDPIEQFNDIQEQLRLV